MVERVIGEKVERSRVRLFYKNGPAYEPLYGDKGALAGKEYYRIDDDAIQAVAIGGYNGSVKRISGFLVGPHDNEEEVLLSMEGVERDNKGLPKPHEIARVAKEQLGKDKFDLVLSVSFGFFRG